MTPTKSENAYQAAMRAHAASFPLRTFLEDLTLHLEFGYVVSMPGLFLMGRPVQKEAPYELLIDPRNRFLRPDAWFVWLAAGATPDKLISCMPYHLPYVMWERNNKLRIYSTETLLNALTRKNFPARAGA